MALLKAIGQALHGLAEPLGYLLWALLMGGVLSILVFLAEIPSAPGSAFAKISDVVEQAVFGRRPVDERGRIACRDAYALFAFPDGWEGAG